MRVEILTPNHATCSFVITNENDHIQKHWINGAFYESHENGMLSYMIDNINRYKGKQCIDIGASIGNHTVFFSKVLECDVISFEPSKLSFKQLIENCRINKSNAYLHNIGLGEYEHEAGIRNNSLNNVGTFEIVDGIGIKIDTLDNLVSGQFDFIKIDVENYNIPLLKGAILTLTNQNECDVFIECETDEILESTNNIMETYGYSKDPNVKLNHTSTYIWKKNKII
jgi:FkbM family methyltransferase